MKRIVVFLCLFIGNLLFATEAHDLARELNYSESYLTLSNVIYKVLKIGL